MLCKTICFSVLAIVLIIERDIVYRSLMHVYIFPLNVVNSVAGFQNELRLDRNDSFPGLRSQAADWCQEIYSVKIICHISYGYVYQVF